MKTLNCAALILAMFSIPTFASVAVSSPANGGTVSSPVQFIASASTATCSKGVASVGVYVNNQLIVVQNGINLNAPVSLSPGKYNTVVEEWDYCGGATYTPIEITVANQSGVFVTSPANNSTVSSPTSYLATAVTSSCSKGVAAMGVYVNNQLVTVQNGASLNTQVNLGAGAQNTVVEEWDYCGGASYVPLNVTVQQNGTKLSNLQASSGWNSWGQGPPNYSDCSPSPCNGFQFSHTPNVSSTSLSGNATQFTLGGPSGTAHWGDVLFSLPVLGQFSTQGLPDVGHTLLPSIHNFTYDADFFVTNSAVTQVLEFDISMYMNGAGMIWGNQCNNLGGNILEIWDNVNAQWVSTGAPCSLRNNAWNHITVQVQRQSDNSLLYQSITLNGVTAAINRTYAPFSVPVSWWGVTVNYQMDGNYSQSPYATYLDNLSLTYW
jgi:hypothetical protein